MSRTSDAVICGAGITGISAAYHLTQAGLRDVLLVDPRPPLSLTSDLSTECYRNWWPDPAMLGLMNRSIDLMEDLAETTGNAIRLNRRGYLYVTADPEKIPLIQERAARTSGLGAGPLREHSSVNSGYQPPPPHDFRGQPEGADLLLDPSIIQKHFPYITPRAAAALHVRRAGWLSAQQLGMSLLETARSRGARVEAGQVDAVELTGGRVCAIRLATGERVDSPLIINAAGPHLDRVGMLAGLELPVQTELHMKASISDAAGALGREAPLLIWDDPQRLPWEEEERRALETEPDTRWLTEEFPAGAHTRPEGGADSQNILMLWEYRTRLVPPAWPPVLDDQFPEIALRGLAAMLPGMHSYFARMPRPHLDGGYYTKTRENRPLIGPTGPAGSFVFGAVSGYGIMSACAAGELLAAHVMQSDLPPYAAAFHPGRYEDPEYVKQLDSLDDSGQL